MGRSQKAGEDDNEMGYTSWVSLTTGRLSKKVTFGHCDCGTVWSLFGMPLMMPKNCIAHVAVAQGQSTRFVCVRL